MSEEKHWSSLNEVGARWGIPLMFWIFRTFGRWLFALVLYPVVAWFWLGNTRGREASRQFLEQAWSTGESTLVKKPGNWTSFCHFLSFGETILDKLATWSGAIGNDILDFPDREQFLAIANSGQGAVLIGSHLGNLDACRAFAAVRNDLKMTVLVHTHHASQFNQAIQRVNPDVQMELMQVTEITPYTGMQLQERVDRGELIVIVGDRTPVGNTTRVSWADFMGKPAPFPQGPFILAGLLDCPVYLLFAIREKGRYRVYLEHFADSLKLSRRMREVGLKEFIGRYAARLSWHAVRAPLQWYNFFDFWGSGFPGREKQESETVE